MRTLRIISGDPKKRRDIGRHNSPICYLVLALHRCYWRPKEDKVEKQKTMDRQGGIAGATAAGRPACQAVDPVPVCAGRRPGGCRASFSGKMKKPLSLLACCCLVALLLSCGTPETKPNPGELLITAGDGYGCDIVFWLDGFGLCYDLGDRWTNDPNACSITLEASATEGRELVFLQDGTEKYCLGELSYRDSGFAYGCRYWMDPQSPQAQLHPTSTSWEACKADLAAGNRALTEAPGVVRSFDAKNCIVNISIGEFALDDMDDGVPYLPEASISDEVLSLRVAESALLIVWWDWGETVVTRDCFFRLLEQEYVGFLPGANLLFDDEELLGYAELYMP